MANKKPAYMVLAVAQDDDAEDTSPQVREALEAAGIDVIHVEFSPPDWAIGDTGVAVIDAVGDWNASQAS